MSEFFSWADAAAEEVAKRKKKLFVCEGMWSPSGYCHIGNARSELFTPYSVFKSLTDKGYKAKQNFIIDDFDAIRKIPENLEIREEDKKSFLGIPYALAPSPLSGYKSWAECFLSELKQSLPEFGLKPDIYSAYHAYKEGKFNSLISFSLDHAKEIVSIWSSVSGAEKAEGFYPLQVFCDECGKIFYSEVTGWDGKQVSYKCGCGHSGQKSPFNGNSKLHWRVHWAAHWILYGVDFESGGKDHFSKGGSVDVGTAMMEQVFHKPAPYMHPTEFIQIHGKKMAGSLGNVITLSDWLQVASPELFRFMVFSYKPYSVVDFSFEDNSFLLLQNRFQEAQRVFYGKEKQPNSRLEKKTKRDYLLSLIENPSKKMPFQIPFNFLSLLAQLFSPETQMPEIESVLSQTGHAKKFSAKERQELEKALLRAKSWLSLYAPQEYKIGFLQSLPAEIREQIPQQHLPVLGEIAQIILSSSSAEDIQKKVYAKAKEKNIPPQELFSAIYLALIGKSSGPRIGSLAIALGKERVAKRLEEL